jgi:hypothetical protein
MLHDELMDLEPDALFWNAIANHGKNLLRAHIWLAAASFYLET